MTGLLAVDAGHEGLPRWWARTVFLVPLLGTVVVGALRLRWPLYVWLLKEDHPVEWSQFGLMTFSTLVMATAIRATARRRDPAMTLLTGLICGSFVFTTGEEISWGQRVIGLVTPQSVARVNGQAELNLHDIRAGIPLETLINFSEMVFAFAAAILPWVLRIRTRPNPPRVPSVSRLIRAACPPLYAVPGFALMAGYRFARFFLLPASVEQSATVVVLKQWMELGFYLSLAAMAVAIAAQARRAPPLRRRHRRSGSDRGGGLRPLLPHAVLATLITVLFAVLTMRSGVAPGN